MPTIDTSYFFGDLKIAQISQPEVTASLNAAIEKKEDELLNRLLGYSLFKDYKAGIIASTQIYKDIRDGKEYTDLNGQLTKWVGLAFTSGTIKRSLIANFVYYHYIKDNDSFTTGSSEKKTSLAINVSPEKKMNDGWNEMVKENIALNEFLVMNVQLYPQYAFVIQDKELFTYKNYLGI
jgi:hypothetical protein